MMILRIAGIALIALGILFNIIAIYGFIRYKSLYARLSFSSLIDSAGFLSVIIGLVLYEGLTNHSLKMIFVLVVMMLLNPLNNHVIGRGAFISGYHPPEER